MDSTTKGKIGIVGSGLIGSSWATLFASAGYSVCLYDISEEQLTKARETVRSNLDKLEFKGLLRGNLSSEESNTLLSATTNMKEALEDCIYVQESTCETVEFKAKIFAEMDNLAPPTCVLASSTSTIPASKFTEQLKNRDRCVVAHPVNPPLFLRLVEVVPAPWTSETTVDTVCRIMSDIGQEPIRLGREVLGFAVNRLQYALLAEAWRLVQDDVLSVEDVDKVMSAGLGPRYALQGPFQTIHLNANGVSDYCSRYAGGIRNVLADFGATPTFEEKEVVEKLENSLNRQMPIEKLTEFKAIREEKLAELAKIKK